MGAGAGRRRSGSHAPLLPRRRRPEQPRRGDRAPLLDKDWRFSAAEAEVDRQKEARSQTQKHTSAVTDSVAEVTSTINQTIWGMWDSIPGQDEVNAGVYNTLNDTMLGLGHAIWGNWLDSNEEVLEAAVVEGREV